MGAGNNQTSPLVLDLTGAGINLTPLAYASPYFDLTGSGFAHKTGWIGTGTGLLCLDRNGDGQINSGLELFGTAGSAADGFAALRQLDTNGDGVIDSNDTQFANLRVWADTNGNGVADAGELFTLAQLGIVSINLNATSVNETIAGNTVKLVSTFTLADGTQHAIGDAWFSNSPTYTRPDVAVSIPPAIASLPQVNGYGSMPDLHAAMAADSTLAGLVQNFAALPSSTDPAVLKSDVQAIMYEWAGVAGLDPSSGGPFVDARQIAFAERQTGIAFGGGSPARLQAVHVNQAWNDLYDGTQARLILQSGAAAEVPEFTYNTAADFVLPTTDLATSLRAAFARLGPIGQSNFSQWDLVLRTADAFRLDAHLSQASYLQTIAGATSDTVASVANALSTGIQVSFAANGSIVETGTNLGSDFYAGPGVSKLVGNKIGVFPHPTETFHFNHGDGALELSELDATSAPDNILYFGAGIVASQVSVSADASGNIILTVGAGGDRITLDGMDGSSASESWHGVQVVQFADGTSLTANQILAMAATGTSGNDRLFGGYAAESFDGKGGNDYAQGCGYGDTFTFNAGYGQLEIYEFNVWGGQNTLKLGAGISAAQVRVTGDSSGNLYLADGIAGDQVKVDYALDSSYYGIQAVQFADGTSWTKAQIIALQTIGTQAGDKLYGSPAAETFDGRGAPAGLQDYEQGGGGNDTFLYNPGYGKLEIYETDYGSNPSNVLKLGAGISVAQVRVTADGSGNLYLTEGISGDQVNLDNALSGSYYGVQQVQFADGTSWTGAQLIGSETAGTPGADSLYGTSGAEVFDGRGGNDYEQGGGGNDTFVYNQGYGQLEIYELDYGSNPSNVLKLGSGISAAQVNVTGDSSGNIYLTDGIGGDQVKLDYGLSGPYYGVQAVQFADGSSWSRAQLVALETTGTSAADSLYGSHGADTFDGEAAPAGLQDYEQGNGGGDSFVYNAGYGHLEVYEADYGASPSSMLKLGSGITAAQVNANGDSSGNIYLTDGISTDQVKLDYEASGSYYGVQTVQFADGTSWTKAQLLAFAGTH